MKKIHLLLLSITLACGLATSALANSRGNPASRSPQNQGQSDAQKKRDQNDPTKNNPDVPRQEPGTDNPDVGKQRHPTPGGTDNKQEGTSTRQAKKKPKPRKDTSTESPKQ